MVQDDRPVGLDGVRVVFDDVRVVSDAGIALARRSVYGWGSSVWSAGVRLRRDQRALPTPGAG